MRAPAAPTTLLFIFIYYCAFYHFGMFVVYKLMAQLETPKWENIEDEFVQ